MEKDLLSIIEETENKVKQKEAITNHDYITYYRSLISALDICMINSYQYIPKKDLDTNYKLFNYMVIPKYISISKAAFDLALSGHPIEAFALTRLLLEISQVTQCLTFHPEYIKSFNEGNMKPKLLRNIIAKETNSKLGGKLFGLLSHFTHSTRELIFVTLQPEINGGENPIISEKSDIIKKAILSITHYVWSQYISYRSVFHVENIANDELRKLDKYIFDIDRIKQLFGYTSESTLKDILLFIEEIDK